MTESDLNFYKIEPNFRQIMQRLNAIVTSVTTVTSGPVSDDDFIAGIEAVNLLCNLCDDLGIDRTGIRRGLDSLYPELLRRISEKDDVQYAVPLIEALYSLIYGRSDDRGPENWRETFEGMCSRVVDSYRKKPLIDIAGYLFALDTVCRVNGHTGSNEYKEEYGNYMAAFLGDIENVTLAERIRRVRAYGRYRLQFVPDNRERWAQVIRELEEADPGRLDDGTFILWLEITDQSPMRELKRRAGRSLRMQVEYLQGQILTEFERQEMLTAVS